MFLKPYIMKPMSSRMGYVISVSPVTPDVVLLIDNTIQNISPVAKRATITVFTVCIYSKIGCFRLLA